MENKMRLASFDPTPLAYIPTTQAITPTNLFGK
jgi:hypothetical protein